MYLRNITYTRCDLQITRQDVMAVRDVMVAGRPLNKSVSAELQDQVACHEIGHALVATLLEDYMEVVQRVTITPTSSGAGGLTFFAPRRNDGAEAPITTRKDLEQKLTVLLAGRAAEEVLFSKMQVSLGASHDLQQAEQLARTMVTSGGMAFKGAEPRVSLQAKGLKAADDVDAAAQAFVTAAYAKAQALLTQHRALLIALAQRLVVDKSMPGAVVRRAARKAAAAPPSA